MRPPEIFLAAEHGAPAAPLPPGPGGRSRVLNLVCQKISDMAEITEFHEILRNFGRNSFLDYFKKYF